MKICRVGSFQHFIASRSRLDREYSEIVEAESKISGTVTGDFFVKAFSYPAGKEVGLLASKKHAKERVDWRESLLCPQTGLNNRLRAACQFFETEFGPDSESVIYLSEQTTRFYGLMKSRFKNLIGSEYLNPSFQGGFINNAGIRHEDLTSLSFDDESIDYCISLECFEHIPDFRKSFSSCHRVLKAGGSMMISVPFILHNEYNTIRAQVNEKKQVIHLLEPEYHLDPIDPRGCLCFTNFGWEIMRDLKNAGFKDAYAVLYWSGEFGYLGGHQVLIIATK